MTLRILHVLDHSLPLHSGYAFRTAAILKQQRALGWETHHLTSPRQGPGSAGVEHVSGWDFHRTPLVAHPLDGFAATRAVREMTATTRSLAALVRQVQPHLIHAHSPVLTALPALAVGRRFRLPVVYEVRAFWEDAAVDLGTAKQDGMRYRLSRMLETFALRRVDAVSTICQGLRDHIVGRGISPDRVTVIPNAVDTDVFTFCENQDEALRKALGLGNSFVLGFVGSFYAYEGLDLLVDALPPLLGRGVPVKLLLVGGGPQEAALRTRVQALGIADHVVFTGRVPNSEVHRYYGLVDILAYPRRSMPLTELVTPLKPLEAMAQGKILIASDVGGHKELVQDGVTGHLFRAGDVDALVEQVSRVMARRNQWDEIRRRGRQFVESERTWRNSVASYSAVYARLTGRSCAPDCVAAA